MTDIWDRVKDQIFVKLGMNKEIRLDVRLKTDIGWLKSYNSIIKAVILEKHLDR